MSRRLPQLLVIALVVAASSVAAQPDIARAIDEQIGRIF